MMRAVWTALIGVGSNLGDRAAYLRSAAKRIAASPGLVLEARSRIYETPPLGPPQPAYLNAALRVAAEPDPEALLDILHGIERDHGRARRERWGPRTLDLDILFGLDASGSSLVIATHRLEVPHPGLRARAFALAPLLDVAPELRADLGDDLAKVGGAPPIAQVAWAPSPREIL